MKERIAMFLLKSAAVKHIKTAKHLNWLKDTIHDDWGTPEKVKKEKQSLIDEAEKHENAARRIQRIINIYNANKSI